MRSVVLLVLAACVGGGDPRPPDIEQAGAVQLELPLDGNRPLDLLLVIDNSPAMAEHQDRLRANLRALAAILHPPPSRFFLGGRASLRLGVVTTDLGGGDCGPGEGGRLRGLIVEHVADSGIALRSYDGELADAIAGLGTVGTTGCALTQPLAAARRAIEHGGFARPDGTLAIVFITARDAHEPSVEGYEAFFKSLRVDYRLVIGGVLGSEDGKLPSFIDRFRRSARTQLAEPDWSPVLGAVDRRPWTSSGVACLAIADVDAAAPDAQHACEVWYEFPQGAHAVPPCGTTLAGPCWQMVEDRQLCPTGDRRLHLERPLAWLPSETTLTVECVSR